jgi:hypothetical protein
MSAQIKCWKLVSGIFGVVRAALVLVCIGRGERSHTDYYNVAGRRPKSVLIKCSMRFPIGGLVFEHDPSCWRWIYWCQRICLIWEMTLGNEIATLGCWGSCYSTGFLKLIRGRRIPLQQFHLADWCSTSEVSVRIDRDTGWPISHIIRRCISSVVEQRRLIAYDEPTLFCETHFTLQNNPSLCSSHKFYKWTRNGEIVLSVHTFYLRNYSVGVDEIWYWGFTRNAVGECNFGVDWSRIIRITRTYIVYEAQI